MTGLRIMALLLALGALAGCADIGAGAGMAGAMATPGARLALQEEPGQTPRAQAKVVTQVRAVAVSREDAARRALAGAGAVQTIAGAQTTPQTPARAKPRGETRKSAMAQALAQRKARRAARQRKAEIAAERAAAAHAAHEAGKARLQVYASGPGRPYTAIGPVRAVVTRRLPIDEAPSRDAAIDALRAQALKLGADGVIHLSVSEMHRVPLTGGGRTATGLAVLFPDPVPAPVGPSPLDAMRPDPGAISPPAQIVAPAQDATQGPAPLPRPAALPPTAAPETESLLAADIE